MDREIMATSTTNDRWLTVLLEAAKNVKLKIREVLLQRRYLSILELKKQLDYEAQKAIRDSLTNAGYPISVISEEGDYTIGDGGPFETTDVDGDGIMSLYEYDNEKLAVNIIDWLCQPQPCIPGDANMDGVINVLDPVKVKRIMLNLDPPTCGADANLDESIDHLDLVEIKEIILGISP